MRKKKAAEIRSLPPCLEKKGSRRAWRRKVAFAVLAGTRSSGSAGSSQAGVYFLSPPRPQLPEAEGVKDIRFLSPPLSPADC